MIRVVFGIFFVMLVDWVNGQGIIFTDEGKNHRPLRSLQIPITVIQGATVAAQPWSSQNENRVNKIFDIPVQTLQSVRSSVKNKNSEQNKFYQQNERRDRIIEIRKQEILEQKRLQQQQRLEQEKLQRDQRKKRLELQEKDDDHSVEKRQARFFDIYGWSSALTDVLLEGFGHGHGHGHGHGSLLNHGGFGGHGGHGGIFDGHKKKKKKKKKPVGSHFGGFNHGNIWGGSHGGHGGHGGHGSHGGHGGHGNHGHGSPGIYGGYGQGSGGIYGGLQQIFGNLNHHYQVTENVDDIAPQRPIFGWHQQQPHRDEEKIQNKIAPGFNDNDNR